MLILSGENPVGMSGVSQRPVWTLSLQASRQTMTGHPSTKKRLFPTTVPHQSSRPIHRVPPRACDLKPYAHGLSRYLFLAPARNAFLLKFLASLRGSNSTATSHRDRRATGHKHAKCSFPPLLSDRAELEQTLHHPGRFLHQIVVRFPDSRLNLEYGGGGENKGLDFEAPGRAAVTQATRFLG
jgi:hypothetical protein